MLQSLDTKGVTPRAIVVMGVSASGKSTSGELLAKKLGCAFFEGDTLHSPAAIEKMRSGEPLTDEDRWPWLDRLGEALRRSVAALGDPTDPSGTPASGNGTRGRRTRR